ncbi:hypothetical protein [Flexithrix dorotheae]|uniref:hypothetical protein n=1 Tax=Flexithrix dorotheae TaxID=70993 RepID=UPI00036D3C98|nr:hypothetical protein [Flexithrix dorotheae]
METIKEYNYQQKHLGKFFNFNACILKDENAYYLKCNEVVVTIKSPESGENLLKQLFTNVVEITSNIRTKELLSA